jgi:hypothetical protein
MWNALVVALFYGALLAGIVHWALRFDPGAVLANFRRIMRINQVTSLGFIGFIGLHLWWRS